MGNLIFSMFLADRERFSCPKGPPFGFLGSVRHQKFFPEIKLGFLKCFQLRNSVLLVTSVPNGIFLKTEIDDSFLNNCP